MAVVGLPLTGVGDSTANVAVDTIGGEAFQRIKLFDGTQGSTVPIVAKATTPAAADGAMVVRPIGSTAFSQAVQVSGGSSDNVVGGVALLAGSSANVVGAVAQGPGSSASSWVVDGLTFSSAASSRTSANTTVDAAVIAANANRKAMMIQNMTTVDLALGLSTAALSTALANISMILASRQFITFGGQVGSLPNYTGPVRGLIIGSSVITGGVVVTQFLNT